MNLTDICLKDIADLLIKYPEFAKLRYGEPYNFIINEPLRFMIAHFPAPVNYDRIFSKQWSLGERWNCESGEAFVLCELSGDGKECWFELVEEKQ